MHDLAAGHGAKAAAEAAFTYRGCAAARELHEQADLDF
jgi:hypothetical protein